MSRILITGSADGLGWIAARLLVADARKAEIQDRFLAECRRVSGVALPE